MGEDLYQQAKADFAQAKARAEEKAAVARRAQAEAAEAQAELASMQNVLDWFEQRRSQKRDEPQERTAAPVAVPESAPGAPARVKKNLSDDVHDAVTQLGGSARNTEILEHLRLKGHNYTPLQVRGAAKHLGQKGRLVSGGYGIWCLPPSVPPSDYSPAAADGAALNGTQEAAMI